MLNKPGNLLTIQQASIWASRYLNKEITESNISYLIQYGKVKKCRDNGRTCVLESDLKRYYDSFHGKREILWKDKLGHDLNWYLSFDHLREKDTTKHVHRLHPYKGKFIPHLVEYFLDSHTDEYKKTTFFKKSDIILDPFCGSGTTLVQANELGLHSIGIDVSTFNCTITEAKLLEYDLRIVEKDIHNLLAAIQDSEHRSHVDTFENELYEELNRFNTEFFPSPSFKRQVYNGKIDEYEYGCKKESEFLKKYNYLIQKYSIKIKQDKSKTFLDKWFISNVRNEMDLVFRKIKGIQNARSKKICAIILSRTIRSCRATTHYDLATLKEPQFSTYYCHKHKKICKPIFSIKKMFNRYAYDTLRRLKEFEKLRTNAQFSIIPGDSRDVNIPRSIKKPQFRELVKKKQIDGIFTSPPYVGQIDYHEQHAYAYDLFGYGRKDELEIGPLYKGQGGAARQSYVEGIAEVLKNCQKYMKTDCHIFIVANDKYNLYPRIAENTGLTIIQQFKRPVLNRSERDKGAYSEIIFYMRRK